MQEMMSYTAEQIQAIGGRRWTKSGMDRVYLGPDIWAPLVGLEVDYYKSGNVNAAWLNGQSIANGRAKKLLDTKVYWESGRIHTTGCDLDEQIHTAITAAVAAQG